MVSIDPYIIKFVTENPVTIGLGVGVLKVIAKLTPGTADDRILTLIGNMFAGIKGRGIKAPIKDA